MRYRWAELVSRVCGYMAGMNCLAGLAAKPNEPAQSLATGWTFLSEYQEISHEQLHAQDSADSIRRGGSLSLRVPSLPRNDRPPTALLHALYRSLRSLGSGRPPRIGPVR